MFDVEYGGIYVSPAQYNNQLIHKKVVIWWFDHWRHYIYGNGPVIFKTSVFKLDTDKCTIMIVGEQIRVI